LLVRNTSVPPRLGSLTWDEPDYSLLCLPYRLFFNPFLVIFRALSFTPTSSSPCYSPFKHPNPPVYLLPPSALYHPPTNILTGFPPFFFLFFGHLLAFLPCIDYQITERSNNAHASSIPSAPVYAHFFDIFPVTLYPTPRLPFLPPPLKGFFNPGPPPSPYFFRRCGVDRGSVP